ncbi:major facilitator superfamily domain-containing protein [Butyriboletus roseoflavus]|nr:major facilitator superfamily domain-containing protein [Butyriboletus roseoflavus]
MVSIAERALDRNSGSLSHWQKEPDEITVHLNKRRSIALGKLDSARLSWIHAKISLIAGLVFFTDAYDVFAITIIVSMLGYVSGDENGDLSSWQSTGLKVAAPVGGLVGQVLLGWLADILGRKRMYGVELVIMVTTTFGQALAGPGYVVNTIDVLILWRFIMGIGCGAAYSLTAIIVSESAPIRTRGRLMTAVFASQGWGQLAAGLVGMIVVVAYGDAIRDGSAEAVDCTWRLLAGLGCIPGLIAYCVRYTIPETPRFTMDIERNITRASRDITNILSGRRDTAARYEGEEQVVAAPRASLADFTTHFSKWNNLKVLIGTAYSRFALEIPFYSLTLNSSAILTYSNFGKINGNSPNDVYESLFRICCGSLVLTAAGFIPGFWASFFFIDSWGRKSVQLMGFAVLAILFLTMAFAYVPLNSTGLGQYIFICLYCLANFFYNFGPNTTTFIIPGEVFPTRYRSTAYGISAACGKIGAIVAQLALGQPFLSNVKDTQIILEVLSFVMLTGILSTLLIPETKQKTLEDLSNERQESYIIGAVERGVPQWR